ncbi:MAG: hypothetical protein AAFR67_07905, partial [Chloroflexota bacterium]
METANKRNWMVRLLQSTEVRVLLVLWFIANTVLLVMGMNGLPVVLGDDPSGLGHVLLFLPIALAYLLQIGLVYFITRNRPLPDWDSRTPEKSIALQETVIFWVYALVALIVLGAGFDIGLHLPGTIFDPDYENTTAFILTWTAVNFVIFALIPYVVFRMRGYTNEQLSMTSHNWRGDLVVIVAILVLET